MNLDDKIARSIDAKFEELALLFNNADDAGDCAEVLTALKGIASLLGDVKTEVKQLQNNQDHYPEDPKDNKDEPEDDPSNDPPPSDPDLPELRKQIRDAVKGIDKVKRLMRPMRKLLPSPDDPIPDWVKDTDWYDMASDIYKIYMIIKSWKDLDDKYGTLGQQIKDLMDNKQTFDEFWKNQEDQFQEGLQDIIDILNSDLEDAFEGIFQIGDDVDMLKNCCREIPEKVTDLILESNSVLDSSIQNAANRGYV